MTWFALSLTTLTALLLASVRADPIPLEPSSTSVFNEGSQCRIQWTADPTGTWKVMNIELMTGSNQQMVHLRTVATVDGTSTTNNSYSYPCLGVDPNSAIYFYQFTTTSSTATLWTTRFTIADATGKSVPPPLQETSPSGEIIHYGIGKLKDQSLVDSPPPRGTNGTTSSSSVNATTSSGPSTPSTVATPTVTLPGDASPNNNSNNSNNNINNNINNTESAAANSPTTQSSQPQKGGAVSYQPTAGVRILAIAILCGSVLL